MAAGHKGFDMKGQGLSRRLVLRSGAATVALPFLGSALWSRRAGAALCQPPRRFMAWFVPNGFNMPDWTPTTAGTTWAPTPISGPLESVRKKILILTGLDMQATAVPAMPPADHGAGTGCFLNMIPVNGHETDPARVSLDQVLLPVLNRPDCGQPLIPSLQLGVQGDNGLCDRATCDFSRSISWRGGVAMPNIYDPALLFDRMFAAATPVPSAAVTARAARRASVLDHVRADANSVSARLSRTDRLKMDQFMTSVRAVEIRIQGLANAPGGSICVGPSRPSMSGPLNFDRGITPSAVIQQNVPIFLDLMKLAFQCDITRAITFMLGNGSSNNDYSFVVGQSAPHNAVSHHGGSPAKLAELTLIDTWETTQIATLLKSLDDIQEIDGTTVLDNTTFYMGSDIGDGSAHNHWDQPVLLAGGASGKMKIDGRHLNYIPSMPFPRPLVGPQGGPHTGRVFLSILAAHGLPSDQFGEATGGPLTELLR